jgi:hypothetical protein
MQVVRSGLWMIGHERRVGQRVGHLDDRDAERLRQLVLPGLVPVGDLTWPAPRQRDGSQPVTGPQSRRSAEAARRIAQVHERECGTKAASGPA